MIGSVQSASLGRAKPLSVRTGIACSVSYDKPRAGHAHAAAGGDQRGAGVSSLDGQVHRSLVSSRSVGRLASRARVRHPPQRRPALGSAGPTRRGPR